MTIARPVIEIRVSNRLSKIREFWKAWINDSCLIIRQQHSIILLALLLCLGVFAYWPGLTADFLYDDYPRIVENPFIKHLNSEILWKNNPSRFITDFTFALNYRFCRLNVWGWHLVSVLIHAANAFLVYQLVLLTFQTPGMRRLRDRVSPVLTALTACLLFLLHPAQTQAVIYIVQRSTLLMTFFYLFGLWAYLKAVLEKRDAFFVLAIAAAYGGMLTKPAMASFPLAVLLYDICFFRYEKGLDRKRTLMFFLLSLSPLVMISLFLGGDDLWEQAFLGFQSSSYLSRLLTEGNVLMTFLRLWIIPVHQNFDYDYRIVSSLMDVRAILSLAVLTAVFLVSIKGFPGNRSAFFSFLWFLITLSPMILFPLPDVIFEHWLYLPCFGFSFLAGYGFAWIVRRHRFLAVGVFLVLAACGFLTFQRVLVWQDPVVFLKDTIARSPHKARPYNNLGLVYLRQGRLEEARRQFEKAIQLSPDYYEAYNNLALIYVQEKQPSVARELLEKQLRMFPGHPDGYLNLASVYMDLGEKEKAWQALQSAKAMNSFNAAVYIGLGNLFLNEGDLKRAKSEFDLALWLNPDSPAVHYNLGNIHFYLGNFYDALVHYTEALKIQPGFVEVHNNLGHLYFYFRDYAQAAQSYRQAIEADSSAPDGYYHLANALYAMGQIDDSKEAAQKAVELYEKRGNPQAAELIKEKLKGLE